MDTFYHHVTLGHLGFCKFSCTLSVGFLAKIHGNGRMRVYKNSTHRSLTCLLKKPAYIHVKIIPV